MNPNHAKAFQDLREWCKKYKVELSAEGEDLEFDFEDASFRWHYMNFKTEDVKDVNAVNLAKLDKFVVYNKKRKGWIKNIDYCVSPKHASYARSVWNAQIFSKTDAEAIVAGNIDGLYEIQPRPGFNLTQKHY